MPEIETEARQLAAATQALIKRAESIDLLLLDHENPEHGNPPALYEVTEARKALDLLEVALLVCDECQKADISGPGKFQGEPIETYHAYHIMLDGCADDDNGPYWRVDAIICYESEQGFVSGELFSSETEAGDYWSIHIADMCFSDDCELAHDDDQTHKPCQAPADGSPCDEHAQDSKRYCTHHLGQIDKLAESGQMP